MTARPAGRRAALSLLAATALSGVFLSACAGKPTAAEETAREGGRPAKIAIGFNPGGDPARIRPLAAELGADLQNELGIPIEIHVAKNYDDLVDAMKARTIDFAFFTSATFVRAEREANAKVLLKKVWLHPFYHAALVTRPGGAKSVADVKGRKIAFVDRRSSSGYLYPMVELRKRGIAEKDLQITWTGNHPESVKKLRSKDVDVIATFADDGKGETGSWNQDPAERVRGARVLWVSGPIPSDPFAVRGEFYDRYPLVTHSLMLALIDSFENKRGRFAEILGAKELMPATSRQYDPVREMVEAFEGGAK